MLKSLKWFFKRFFKSKQTGSTTTNGEKLEEAARAPPQAAICHNSVLYWIKEAGFISKKKFKQIQKKTEPGTWDRILAHRNPDNLVQNFPQGLADLPTGAIIGFIDPMMLQHSMVVVGEDNGETYVAGVNNLNVLYPNVAAQYGVNYALVTVDKLKPLNQDMEVYWVHIDTVLEKIEQAYPSS